MVPAESYVERVLRGYGRGLLLAADVLRKIDTRLGASRPGTKSRLQQLERICCQMEWRLKQIQQSKEENWQSAQDFQALLLAHSHVCSPGTQCPPDPPAPLPGHHCQGTSFLQHCLQHRDAATRRYQRDCLQETRCRPPAHSRTEKKRQISMQSVPKYARMK